MFGRMKVDTFVALFAAGFLCGRATAIPLAAPIRAPHLVERQAITALTTNQITAFRPYTHYASTGYCEPATTLAWDCGANCEANPQFIPVASGGDGDLTQFCA